MESDKRDLVKELGATIRIIPDPDPAVTRAWAKAIDPAFPTADVCSGNFTREPELAKAA